MIADQPVVVAPGLVRRMACFLYEGVLLFGVLMISGYFYSALTQQRHALHGRHGLQAFLFIVLAIYFVGFWSHGGQTVAMKAWHMRLVGIDGGPVGQGRAFARYLLSWLWFLPALIVVWALDVHALAPSFLAMAIGVVGFAALTRLHPSRQYWHDVACGTRLVDWHPRAQPEAVPER